MPYYDYDYVNYKKHERTQTVYQVHFISQKNLRIALD
jgi:hypothetical protein